MTYDKLENLNRYFGAHNNIDTAINYIQQGIEHLQMGRTVVDDDKVYINCFEYDTMLSSQLEYESHLSYIDMHIILEGNELVEINDNEELQELSRNEKEDCVILQGNSNVTVKLTQSHFLLAYPREAHKPKIFIGKSMHVRKAVFKILL